MARYCPHCFCGVDDDASICHNCGEPLTDEQSTQKEVSVEIESACLEKETDEVESDRANNSLSNTTIINNSQKMPDENLSETTQQVTDWEKVTPSTLESDKNPSNTNAENFAKNFMKDDAKASGSLSEASVKDKDEGIKAASVPDTTETMSLGQWMLTLLLCFIPVVNLIMLIIWAVSGNTNPNKKNFARAGLIWYAIGVAVWIIVVILIALFSVAAYMAFI